MVREPAVLRVFGVAAVAIVLSGVLIVFLHFLTSLDILVLIADPAAEVGLAPYVGVFTYLGVLVLWSGATSSVLGSKRSSLQRDAAGMKRMLATLGGLLAWLAIDDLFLLHEEIGLALAKGFGREADRSLFEAPVVLLYAMVWGAWLVIYRAAIVRTFWPLLLAGLTALGVSVAVDIGEFVFPDLASRTTWTKTTLAVSEELAKLGGYILLSGYAVVTSEISGDVGNGCLPKRVNREYMGCDGDGTRQDSTAMGDVVAVADGALCVDHAPRPYVRRLVRPAADPPTVGGRFPEIHHRLVTMGRSALHEDRVQRLRPSR